MNIGDLVIRRRSPGETNPNLDVGVVIEITKGGSIFVYWPKNNYKCGYNDYAVNDRLVVVSEKD